MWHEARKQERKIRGIMVDYKKRAERRREFYEKIKQDPTQFLRLHGMPCKINLDQAVAIAAEGPGTMMPWQGDTGNMIDRFDARAHLDQIPETTVVSTVTKSPAVDREEHKCNYERYRTLVQNECAGITEEQCLHQITEDEMFPEASLQKKIKEEKDKLMGKKAAIGFTYDEKSNVEEEVADSKKKDELGSLLDSDSDSSDSLSDLDIDINVDVDELDYEQRLSMNECAEKYGMAPGEYVRMLEKDKEEVEMLKRAKEEEEEKAMYSGRKSRRERRAFIEKRLRERRDTQPSPPSYARRNSPTYQPYQRRSRSHSSSRSRSTTPEETGRVTFITSFGEDDNSMSHDTAAMATSKSSEPQSWQSLPLKRSRSSSSSSFSSKSRSRSRSKDKSSSSRSRSRSRSKSSSRSRSRSKSKSKSRSRSRSTSRSRSRSKSGDLGRLDRGGRYGRSNSRSGSSRSRSRSPPRRRYRRSRSSSSGSSRSRSRSPQDRYQRRSLGGYRARSRSKSPTRAPYSQYNINAKLKRPELGFAKSVGSADKVTKVNTSTKTQVTDAKTFGEATQSRQSQGNREKTRKTTRKTGTGR